MKNIKNILLSLPILLLALPYIFLSTYGNSSFDSWIQYSIVVVSVIYVITGIYHLIKNKELDRYPLGTHFIN